MLPAFRSNPSVLTFCGLMLAAIALPLVNRWIGHPSREQCYKDMSIEAGPLNYTVQKIFNDPKDADILFLGSSLVRAAVDTELVERGLSSSTGKPAHVVLLGLNWQGLDEQYFLLRDYLQTHRARLIIWNMPVPGSRNLQPHVQAFHFVRFGEYGDALANLSARYRWALYADMTLGAPRELLSHIRPNRLSPGEVRRPLALLRDGYHGKTFVDLDDIPVADVDAMKATEKAPFERVLFTGQPLNAYERHFAQGIMDLARNNGSVLAFLHVPIDEERGMDVMPERSGWSDMLPVDAAVIGVPSAELFRKVKDGDFTSYYSDQHLNANGGKLFTKALLPAILDRYRYAESRNE